MVSFSSNSKAIKSLLCELEVLLRLIQKWRSKQMLRFTYETRLFMEIIANKIFSDYSGFRIIPLLNFIFTPLFMHPIYGNYLHNGLLYAVAVVLTVLVYLLTLP